MKSAVIFIFLIFSAACSIQSVESQKVVKDQSPNAENQSKEMVLVELFTSEG